jgi:hypothetical protein
MSQADEFRAYANECLEFVRTASPEQRPLFLEMAEAWLRAAAAIDGGPPAPIPDARAAKPPHSPLGASLGDPADL